MSIDSEKFGKPDNLGFRDMLSTDGPALLLRSQNEPWGALQECKRKFAAADRGYQEDLRILCAAVIGVAYEARRSESLRVRIYNDPIFSDRSYVLNPAHILRHTFQVATNGKRPSRKYERALDYAVATGQYFRDEIPVFEIPDRIKADGGLDELADKAAARRAAAVGTGLDSKLIPRGTNASDNCSDERGARPGAAMSGLDETVASQPLSRRKRPTFDPLRQLVIDAAEEHIEDVLGMSDSFEEAIAVIRKESSDNGGFDRLIVTDVQVVKRTKRDAGYAV